MSFGLWSHCLRVCCSLRWRCGFQSAVQIIGETIVSFVLSSWEDGALSRLNHSATQPFFFPPLFPKYYLRLLLKTSGEKAYIL